MKTFDHTNNLSRVPPVLQESKNVAMPHLPTLGFQYSPDVHYKKL